MIFEYMYEVLDEAQALKMQQKLKVPYLIGGIMLCINFTMEEGTDLVVRSTEILYVVDTESDVPIMINKEMKYIVADYIDYDVVDAACYAQWDSESKDWGDCDD